ncbi:MAG TPA: electron transporter RnfB [Mollicutes bacterium]|nr:electron transporter RnfB [Mollicutes bacterium]
MQGIIIFTIISFFVGVVLAITNKTMNKEDKRIAEVTNLLPGYNCGACGFGGCADMAFNIIEENVDIKRCKPMREEQYKKLKQYLDDHVIK